MTREKHSLQKWRNQQQSGNANGLEEWLME